MASQFSWGDTNGSLGLSEVYVANVMLLVLEAWVQSVTAGQ